MIEPMIPLRNPVCPGGNYGHRPRPVTVESEWNLELEWQFGTCNACSQSVSRFRTLRGGTWFDQWGSIETQAYLENLGRTSR